MHDILLKRGALLVVVQRVAQYGHGTWIANLSENLCGLAPRGIGIIRPRNNFQNSLELCLVAILVLLVDLIYIGASSINQQWQ